MAVLTPSLVLSSSRVRPGVVAVVARYGDGGTPAWTPRARACARLVSGVQVRQTASCATSQGELAASFSSRVAIEEDCQVIRAVESLGLDQGAAQ